MESWIVSAGVGPDGVGGNGRICAHVSGAKSAPSASPSRSVYVFMIFIKVYGLVILIVEQPAAKQTEFRIS